MRQGGVGEEEGHHGGGGQVPRVGAGAGAGGGVLARLLVTVGDYDLTWSGRESREGEEEEGWVPDCHHLQTLRVCLGFVLCSFLFVCLFPPSPALCLLDCAW